MNRDKFHDRLIRVTQLARSFADQFVVNEMPETFLYLVQLNQSYDGHPLKVSERIYPDEVQPAYPMNADDVVDLLCRDDHVPEWIDISVEAVDEARTYMRLRCCGRFTDDDSLLYYPSSDFSPFACKSPEFPPRWAIENGKFDLKTRPKWPGP
jgi:hypothetical protein